MRIGFFDSGIGGLSVLYEALKILPHEAFIYYADTINAPYGTKPKKLVNDYIFRAVDFLIQQEIDAIVVACNTATSVAIDQLRHVYSIPIIGMEPAVKPAVERSIDKNKRVLVTATPLTLKEEKLKNLIARLDNNGKVDLLPLPMLVEFAEGGEFGDKVVLPYLQQQLSHYQLDNYSTVVLGCTHFPFFKDYFRLLLPEHIDIIDGSNGTVNHLKRLLNSRKCSSNGKCDIVYYDSSLKVEDSFKIKRFDDLLRRLSEIHK